MTKIDTLRLRIKALNGANFTCKDVGQGYVNAHKFIGDLEANGEIKFVGYFETIGRHAKMYSEIKVREVRNKEVTKREKSCEQVESAPSPWMNIWPEFFLDPLLHGNSRVFVHLTD